MFKLSARYLLPWLVTLSVVGLGMLLGLHAGLIWLLAFGVGGLVSLLEGRRLVRRLNGYSRMLQQLRRHNFLPRQPGQGVYELRLLEIELNKLSRHMQRALSDLDGTNRQLIGVLNGMQEGVLITDRNRRIILANQALQAILRAEGPVLGRGVLEVCRSPELMEALEKAMAASSPLTVDIPLRFPGELEGHRQLSMRLSRWLDHRAPAGVVAVISDLTGVRRLEQVRRDFVANASHELRTPIAAIRGFAELLLDDERLPDDVKSYIETIERNSRRLTALVDDILALARIESPTYRPRLERVDLKAVVESVMKSLEGLARERRVGLQLEPVVDLAPALAEHRGMEHVVSNLVDNALKYTPPMGQVTIRIVWQGDQVGVDVIDTGVGIPSADLERVFERFYRVDSARSRAVGGTGLGLSIVKHLVQVMGGSVSVSSVYGAGSTFRVRFPVYEME